MVENDSELREFNDRFKILIELVRLLANMHPEVWDIVQKNYPELEKYYHRSSQNTR